MKSCLLGVAGSQRGVQRIQNLGLAGVEGFVALAALRQIDHHFVGVGIGDVADLLDDAFAQSLLGQALANLVHRAACPQSAHTPACRP